MSEGPVEELNLTEFAQPAIMVSSLVTVMQLNWAYYRHMYGVTVDSFQFAFGHSLGEYTANVIAGSLTIEEGVKLARLRGKAMQQAVQGLAIRMTAVAASESKVRSALAEVRTEGICEIAGINHDHQVVLSGTQGAVDATAEYIKEKYKVATMKLNVSAPFHCQLMRPAAEVVQRELSKITVKDAAIPVISNAFTVALQDADELKKSLVENISNPALFLKGMEYVMAHGANLFTELAPKKLLINLVSKIAKDRNLQDLILDTK